jgi:hypothetical protein
MFYQNCEHTGFYLQRVVWCAVHFRPCTVFCDLFHGAAIISEYVQYHAIVWLLTNELESVWKKAIFTKPRDWRKSLKTSDYWDPFPDLNRVPPEYKYRALLIRQCSHIIRQQKKKWPITVAAWSKAWNVFAHSSAAIMRSNPTQDVDVCVLFLCVCVVLCVCSCLVTGWSPVLGVLPTVYKIKELKKRSRSKRGLRAIDR